MRRIENCMALSGRLLLSAIFIASGFHKVMNWDQTAAQMGSEGIVAVPVFLVGAIVFELAGGLALLVGFRARIAALALVVFLVPVTVIFHDFWQKEGTQFQMQMAQFLKNLAILGGLLTVAAFGPGRFSLDGPARTRAAATGGARKAAPTGVTG